jgi:SHAQKYF class myb-like DNA-binding protein
MITATSSNNHRLCTIEPTLCLGPNVVPHTLFRSPFSAVARRMSFISFSNMSSSASSTTSTNLVVMYDDDAANSNSTTTTVCAIQSTTPTTTFCQSVPLKKRKAQNMNRSTTTPSPTTIVPQSPPSSPNVTLQSEYPYVPSIGDEQPKLSSTKSSPSKITKQKKTTNKKKSGKKSGKKSATNGMWSKEEHELFLQGYELHGHNWKAIADLVKTRNRSQVASHAQKFLQKKKKIEELKDSDSGAVSSLLMKTRSMFGL